MRKLELEEAREVRKLEMETRNQESEREAKLTLQRLIFAQAGMERGMTKEQVEAFISLAYPLTQSS